MMSFREHKLAEVQKMCKDAGQNMFNLALAAKNSGEVKIEAKLNLESFFVYVRHSSSLIEREANCR